MRSIPVLLLIFNLSFSTFAQTQDRHHVITHNRQTIVTDPSRGENLYPAWGIFPGQDKDIRKILMHVTLGTPDDLPTAHWDYKDHITIRRAGGVNGDSLNYEIGRMLTPYGSIYSTA